MKPYVPERAIFNPAALKYPIGNNIFEKMKAQNVEVIMSSPQHVPDNIPGLTDREIYIHSKRTIYVTVKKGAKLEICKPSADYQFSLSTNCPGHCEYCYLQTTQGHRPYLRVFVNIDEIFDTIKNHIDPTKEVTTFEAASLGDPLALEHLTGTLRKTIEFFGSLKKASLRIVTKFDNIEPLIGIKHNGNTKFRISVNSRYVIKNFEHSTSSYQERINMASKLVEEGYPLGFIIAPILHYDGWKKEYEELLSSIASSLSEKTLMEPITFELIQHRFTKTAKEHIYKRFPKTLLDMNEENRTLKWGKYGKFKYVYKTETANEIKEYLQVLIKKYFPESTIEYFT